MADRLPERLRRFVARRAHHRCEYCLLNDEDSFHPHQVDHIVSRKHGGASDPPNLAYACLRCNLWKGSAIGSPDPETGVLVPLFHPRRDNWSDHFVFDGPIIQPLTGAGSATVRLLRLNHPHRISERQLLIAVGRHPHPESV